MAKHVGKAHSKVLCSEGLGVVNVGRRLIRSAREAVSIAEGKAEPAGGFAFDGGLDVAAIRKKLGLSQERFAARFRLSPASVRDWEQGRRKPDRLASNYLRVIDSAPEVVERALAAGGA